MNRRIVFFSTLLGRGGAETQLVRVAIGLKARGWEPSIVSLIDRNVFGAVLDEHAIPHETLRIEKGRPDPRAAVRLLRVLRRDRPAILCTFLVAANTLGRPVGRLARVPIVVSSIRTPVLDNPKREWMLRLSEPFHDAVVFNSQVVCDDAIARGLVDPQESSVIRNGLDVESLDRHRAERNAIRAELGIRPDEFMWLVVGNLRPEKNYPTLVQAFRRVHEQYPRTRLVSAGGYFSDHEPVLALVPDLLESGVVRLLGERRDVPRLLAAADAFVLASHYDSSPNGLIEALAARLPAVATRVGGVPEIIPGPREGILSPTSGLEDLSAAMLQMMALDDDARRALGEGGRAHVERAYGGERLIDEWEALFERLLADKGLDR